MHADNIEERHAVDVPAGAGAAGYFALRGARGSRRELRTIFGNARRLEISFAAHDGGNAGSIIASRIGVIGKAGGHEQRAQVGIAKSQRTVIMRVAGDGLSWVSGVIIQN